MKIWQDKIDEIREDNKRLAAERDALQAKLAVLQGQEPVAWMDPWTQKRCVTDYEAYGERGIPLYAAAGEASNAWKEAILDVMTIYGMDAPNTDAPEKILKELIELATRVAIDSAAPKE